jgi:predicted transcriptional regulator with HTH domain
MNISEIRSYILDYVYPRKIYFGDVVLVVQSNKNYIKNKLLVYVGKENNILSMVDYQTVNKNKIEFYWIYHLHQHEHKFKYVKRFNLEKIHSLRDW